MRIEVAGSIPYERQHEPRSCGAAVLCMVYRSFARACTQSEIWERIAQPGPWGVPRTNTKRLGADLRDQGLNALILQARQPWQILRQCAAHGIRVILNHLLRSDSPIGHYSVVVAVQDEHLVLHDPAGEAERQLARTELLELWEPSAGRSEIAGHVLVAVCAAPQEGTCTLCETPTPAFVPCPRCREAIVLQPVAALGCVAPRCPARLWERLFCPQCDIPMSTISI